MAIVIPKEDKKASELVLGGILLSLFSSLLLLIVLLTCKTFILRILNINHVYYWWFYFIPFTVFFASSYRVLNNWLIRKKAFRWSSGNKVIRRGGEAIVQVSFGLKHFSMGLVIGDLIGNLINFLFGLMQLFRSSLRIGLNFKNIYTALKEYTEFPKYNAIPVLFNTMALMLPVIIINKLFDNEITAYFDLTRQIFAITLALISASVAQVYLQRIAEKRNRNERILPEILKLSKVLGVISVIGIVIVLIFGPDVFSLVFGAEYRASGYYAQILIFSFAIRFIASTLSIVFITLQKLRMNAIWQILYFIAIASLFMFRYESIKSFLFTYLIIDVIFYAVYYALIVIISNQHDKNIKLKNGV
jgi:O-antigen/teichoic acid export membrane protein